VLARPELGGFGTISLREADHKADVRDDLTFVIEALEAYGGDDRIFGLCMDVVASLISAPAI
jgi:hypothetical protein